ncbi:hypothetical protein [uncultured Kiloniella sp.]|uniref:hypothetical protein n=1 Tax=uncultured Kiloniella sp. TaxID=1133091 RepID=UPI0026031973|nr:hypothetical protein [uncultured Kiloniella sp.]
MTISGKKPENSTPLTNDPDASVRSLKAKEIELKYATPLFYSSDNSPDPKPPRVECYLDRENHIRHMVYIGALHHDQLVREVLEIWQNINHLDKYNNLIDLRFHKGDVGWHTVKEIGRQWDLFFEGKAPPVRTAFISRHIAFNFLIKAMQALAPEHTFQAFKTKQEAMDWLAKAT